MARNQARISREATGRVAWARLGRAALFWGAALLLALLTWVELQSAGRLAPAALFGLAALLAVTLERALSASSLERRWSYRLAFALSAGLPAVLWAALQALMLRITSDVLPGAPALAAFSFGVALLRLGLAALGAFGGGLVATGLNEGLWENNSPPAEWVQDEVHQMHRKLIGVPGPVPLAKRAFDIALASLGLLFACPVWLLSIFLVWFEDPGPVFFVKNSVGKGGLNFHQFKLRTMVCGAEEGTGPVLSQQGDRRVLLFGKLLRKTALDELPQLINILRGEMSFVGPRPQRTVLVHGYLQAMPEYAERHRVLPGLAGLAQVAGDYYLTPRQKLRFDCLYIRHVSLGFDLKLIWLACLITFWYRWRKDWDGRLPRKLFRWGAS